MSEAKMLICSAIVLLDSSSLTEDAAGTAARRVRGRDKFERRARWKI